MSTQPISLPTSSNHNHNYSNQHHNYSNGDYPMASGSYTGSTNGDFNPASYTRHFMGSPISWRPGSLGFGGRVFPNGSPMDHMLSSVEFNRQSSSYESDRGSIINALSRVDREDELCRNYSCCGLHLNDLHALIEHFEEVHIIVVDHPSAPGGQQSQIAIPFNPTPIVAVPGQQLQHAGPEHHQQQYDVQQQQPQQQSNQSFPNPSFPHLHAAPARENQYPVTENQYPVPFDPDDMELEMDLNQHYQNGAQPISNGTGPTSNGSSPSSGTSTPPDTPVSTPLSSYPSPIAYPSPKGAMSPQLQVHQPHSPYSTSPHHSPYASQPPSPHSYIVGDRIAAFEMTTMVRRLSGQSSRSATPDSPVQRPNLNLNLTSFSRPPSTTPHQPTEPFNQYARYAADYSVAMPGAELGGDSGITGLDYPNTNSVKMECVPPALVFSNAATPESTPSTSRVPSPGPAIASKDGSPVSRKPSPVPISPIAPSPIVVAPGASSSGSARPSSSLTRPPSASLLLSKPFKCPKPNCNKSYKQANGLKYHITHGSCNFAPPKDFEHVQALLEKKRRDRAAQNAAEGHDGSEADRSDLLSPTPLTNSSYGDLSSITENDLRDVEREAEKRLRPFACCVGDCTRRYKNMNGLRYHYQHSGEHGVIGLGLLASGMHECLNNNSGANSRDSSVGREGRKARPSSKPGSRSTSISRTSTPITPAGVVAQMQHYTAPAAFPSPQSSSFPSAVTAQVQAQAQLAYQQRYADNQRAQYQMQQQMQQQATTGVQHQQVTAVEQQLSEAQQQQQLQQMQAQFAAMHNRMYTDATMSG
ncbi:hypothetical protein C8J56DRAFT_414811 [Mycena floridula]|nr:hypothetical protein C8J56DRAFT_414811 [Mycena floridula]